MQLFYLPFQMYLYCIEELRLKGFFFFFYNTSMMVLQLSTLYDFYQHIWKDKYGKWKRIKKETGSWQENLRGKKRTGTLAHTCNLNTHMADGRKPWTQGQPGLHRKTRATLATQEDLIQSKNPLSFWHLPGVRFISF